MYGLPAFGLRSCRCVSRSCATLPGMAARWCSAARRANARSSNCVRRRPRRPACGLACCCAVASARGLGTVLAEVQRVSPAVERGEDGYLFLDLRGLQAMYGELSRLEEAIRDAVPPLLRPRLGLGSGKFAAAVAARIASPGEARTVPASETEAFLAPLSVNHLLMLDPDVLQRLELLGLRTIGDLAELPFGAVQAEFAPPGAA